MLPTKSWANFYIGTKKFANSLGQIFETENKFSVGQWLMSCKYLDPSWAPRVPRLGSENLLRVLPGYKARTLKNKKEVLGRRPFSSQQKVAMATHSGDKHPMGPPTNYINLDIVSDISPFWPSVWLKKKCPYRSYS